MNYPTPMDIAEHEDRDADMSAVDRLANICAALEEDLNESPFTREEWERLDAERLELLKANDALAADNAALREKHDAISALEIASRREADELRKDAERWRELESVGRQYRFPSIWGGTIWLDSSNDYNGSRYTETREIFARREAIDAAMGEKP